MKKGQASIMIFGLLALLVLLIMFFIIFDAFSGSPILCSILKLIGLKC